MTLKVGQVQMSAQACSMKQDEAKSNGVFQVLSISGTEYLKSSNDC